MASIASDIRGDRGVVKPHVQDVWGHPQRRVPVPDAVRQDRTGQRTASETTATLRCPRTRPPRRRLPISCRFLTGKQALFTHASNQNNAWLHELGPENRLWINRTVAERKGIADGDLVRVRSRIGQVEVRALVTDRIRPDCVHMPHGFGHTTPWLTQRVRTRRQRPGSD